MKRLLFPLFFLLFVACQREEVLPEATSAAKEVYLQYADRKDLTVALIGDYQGYNAVMLQAQDAEGWLRLCEEFGVGKNVDANALDSTKVSSLTTVSRTGGTTRNIDSVETISNALLQRVIDSVLQEVVRSGNMSGKVVIDTAYSFVHREHYHHGVLVDSSTTTHRALNLQNNNHSSDSSAVSDILSNLLDNKLLDVARQNGYCGYIVYDNSTELTLWLFFYSNNDEYDQIINNIISKNISG